MNLAELRATVLDYLDLKVEHETFGPGQLDRRINTAYRTVVAKVETAAPHYNVSEVLPVLTTAGSSPPREYDMSAAPFSPAVTNVRKILDCAKRNASGVPYDLPTVSFAKRNAWLGRPGDVSNPVPRSAVYFYRSFTDASPAIATWYLGFVDTDPPISTEFEVRYAPNIVALAADTDIPLFVPEAWHHVIALKAAVSGKSKENRENVGLFADYAEALADMQQDLPSAISRPQVQIV